MAPYLLGDRFGTVFPHHESTQALWDNTWKFQCSKAIYPFNDANIADFEPIFAELIKNNINDAMVDAWTDAFLPHINSLMAKAKEAEMAGKNDQASDMYLRSASLCHIAHFPVLLTPKKLQTWELHKTAYLKGTSFWPSPPCNVQVPHKYAIEGEGGEISVFVRTPPYASASNPVPCVVLFSGLDGFKTDIPGKLTNFIFSQGWAYVAVDIPGTGDSPALKNDPESPDRAWSSLLDWVNDNPAFDNNNIAVWGLSTGGYYALRIAHTHATRLKGVVAQGGMAHHALDPEWLRAADTMEYPGSLVRSMTHKLGYKTAEEMFKDSRQRFSLIETDIVNKPHTTLFMLNGVDDSIFPIEDMYLMLQYGGPKEARFFKSAEHMGEPGATPAGCAWLKRLFSQRGEVANKAY